MLTKNEQEQPTWDAIVTEPQCERESPVYIASALLCIYTGSNHSMVVLHRNTNVSRIALDVFIHYRELLYFILKNRLFYVD